MWSLWFLSFSFLRLCWQQITIELHFSRYWGEHGHCLVQPTFSQVGWWEGHRVAWGHVGNWDILGGESNFVKSPEISQGVCIFHAWNILRAAIGLSSDVDLPSYRTSSLTLTAVLVSSTRTRLGGGWNWRGFKRVFSPRKLRWHSKIAPWKRESPTSHHFSGSMLVFGGVLCVSLCAKKETCNTCSRGFLVFIYCCVERHTHTNSMW